MENGNAGGRKRKVMIRFRVTEDERDMICEKMKQYHTTISRHICGRWRLMAM